MSPRLTRYEVLERMSTYMALVGANLTGVNLSGVILNGADLSGADLRGADLSRASLQMVILRDANLCGANLSHANMREADLRNANLSKTQLIGTRLSCSSLVRTNLRDAVMSRTTDLFGATLSETNLRGVNLEVFFRGALPVIPNIDRAILGAIKASQAAQEEGLNMRNWHTCDTTHCRGGWAIKLAGRAGTLLEKRFDSPVAAGIIYALSGSHPVPDWYTNDESAMQNLRSRARRA